MRGDRARPSTSTTRRRPSFDYPDLQIVWTQRNWGETPDPEYPWGATLYGDKGTLKISVQSYDFIPHGDGHARARRLPRRERQVSRGRCSTKKPNCSPPPPRAATCKTSSRPAATRSKPVADIEEGHISSACCILANLSMDLGRSLQVGRRRRPRHRRRRSERAARPALSRPVGASHARKRLASKCGGRREMARRARFSLATMMLAITVCAAALAAWRMFVYEPPTHKIAAYEKAPGTRGRFHPSRSQPHWPAADRPQRPRRHDSLRRRSEARPLNSRPLKRNFCRLPPPGLTWFRLNSTPAPSLSTSSRCASSTMRNANCSRKSIRRTVGERSRRMPCNSMGSASVCPRRLIFGFAAHSYDADDFRRQARARRRRASKAPGHRLVAPRHSRRLLVVPFRSRTARISKATAIGA